MTTAIIKVCKFVSAKQYHLYFPQVKGEKRIFEKIIFFVQDHLKQEIGSSPRIRLLKLI
mgnify:CR=1 FL=1